MRAGMGVRLHKSNGRWCACYRDSTGKRVRKYIGPVAEWSKTKALQAAEDIAKQHVLNPGARDQRRAPLLSEWRELYLQMRTDLKVGSVKLHTCTLDLLEEHFGPTRRIDRISRLDAAGFRRWLCQQREPACEGGQPGALVRSETTVCGHIRNCKVIFGRARDQDLCPINPFDRERGTAPAVHKDWAQVTIEATRSLMEACNSQAFRCLIALCRFGGLRRGEAHRLAWQDVDFDRRVMWVIPEEDDHGQRVEGTKQRARQVPICPELYDILRTTLELAEDGSVGPCSSLSSNNLLRTMYATMKRARLPRWKDPYKTLRKCRENEWMAEHPVMTVTAWMGHSPAVAQAHYVRPSDEAVRKVTGQGQKTGPETYLIRDPPPSATDLRQARF